MSAQQQTPTNDDTGGKLAEALGPEATRRLGRLTTTPAQLMLAFVIVFPTIVTVYISMTWWTPLDGVSWVHAHESWAWFDNYIEVFLDKKLAGALWRTLLIVVVGVTIQFFLGFGLAVLFVEKFTGRSIYYTLLLMPMMVVPAVSGYMFLMLFQSTGPVNQIIGWIIGQPFEAVWLADSTLAVVAVIAADVWQWTPDDVPDPAGWHDGRARRPAPRRQTSWGKLVSGVLAHRAAPNESGDRHRHRHSVYRRHQAVRHHVYHNPGWSGRRDRDPVALHLQADLRRSGMVLCGGTWPDNRLCHVSDGDNPNQDHEVAVICTGL